MAKITRSKLVWLVAGILLAVFTVLVAVNLSSGGKKIGREIDDFNAVNREEARRAGAKWVDITGISRGTDAALVARDGLHPSGRQYAAWAKAIAAQVR